MPDSYQQKLQFIVEAFGIHLEASSKVRKRVLVEMGAWMSLTSAIVESIRRQSPLSVSPTPDVSPLIGDRLLLDRPQVAAVATLEEARVVQNTRP